MAEAASHRAAGSFANAITCYTDLLSTASDHEGTRTNISIELAKTRLLAGLQLTDHTLIVASLSALQTLPQPTQVRTVLHQLAVSFCTTSPHRSDQLAHLPAGTAPASSFGRTPGRAVREWLAGAESGCRSLLGERGQAAA
jgi:hypothetical protein